MAFVDHEIPSGTINSSNTAFTIASTPIASSEQLYYEGQLMIGGGTHYTLSGTTLTMAFAPKTGTRIEIFYRT